MLSVKPLEFNKAQIGGLRDLRPLPTWPRLRRLVPWLIAVVALLAVAVWLGQDHDPESLADSRLVGPRSPVPLSVNVLLDESGSFAQYAPIRETLMRELAVWAPDNLRSHDVVTVIGFAGTATVRLRPVTVAELATNGARYDDAKVDTDGTRILPALQKSVAVRPVGIPSTIVVVTDTDVSDAIPSEAAALAKELGATTMTTLLPSDKRVSDEWSDAFAWGQVITSDPRSVEETGLALAHAIAHATGQTVEEKT